MSNDTSQFLHKGGNNIIEIPVWEKVNLTIEEASAYSNIGINKLRELANSPNCDFILQIGAKKLIKRKKFEAFCERKAVL